MGEVRAVSSCCKVRSAAGAMLRLLSLAFALFLLLDVTAAQAITYPSLFGTRELHSGNLKMFPKWRGVRDRYHQEENGCADCDSASWEKFVQKTKAMDRMGQLKAVNDAMNAHRYVVDPINWNKPDYWATPFQFLRKNGDCEDYAISKFMALRALGVPDEEMRVVVLQDLNLRLAHAVLAVYVNGQAMILDNQIKTVIPATKIHHYQPVYSVNEEGWWKHFP